MTPVFHKKCDNILFYIKDRASAENEIHVVNMILLDGSPFIQGSIITCKYCNERVTFMDQIYLGVEWMDWFRLPEFEFEQIESHK